MITLEDKEKESILKYKSYISLKQNNKLCIISHYDKNHNIEDYVKYMVKQLYNLGFDIVFVSTSENISLEKFDKLKDYLHTVVIRENVGYDFISWKTGLSFVKNYKEYESILHINDSIFFPLVNPKKMFKKMDKKGVDFWGLTDSLKQTYHLESFFLVVNKNLLQSDIYRYFWNNCTILENKNEIISKYEMGFTTLFLNHGYKCSAYIQINKVLKKIKNSFKENSSENLEQKRSFNYFWDIIIKEFKAPFVKKKILIKSHSEYNPTTFSYKKVLKKRTSYDIGLIKNFLKREKEDKLQIKEKAKEFFINLDAFNNAIKEFKNSKNLVIYGFGEAGYLVYSNLQNSISKIIDQNYTSLSSRYKHIDKFNSINAINKDDEILITAFGREDSILNYLENMNIKYKKLISIEKKLSFSSLKFSNNLTKLLYNIDSLYRFCIEKNYRLSIFTSSKELKNLLENYLKLSAIKNIDFVLCEEVDSLYFLIFSSKKLISKSSFIFV